MSFTHAKLTVPSCLVNLIAKEAQVMAEENGMIYIIGWKHEDTYNTISCSLHNEVIVQQARNLLVLGFDCPYTHRYIMCINIEALVPHCHLLLRERKDLGSSLEDFLDQRPRDLLALARRLIAGMEYFHVHSISLTGDDLETIFYQEDEDRLTFVWASGDKVTSQLRQIERLWVAGIIWQIHCQERLTDIREMGEKGEKALRARMEEEGDTLLTRMLWPLID